MKLVGTLILRAAVFALLFALIEVITEGGSYQEHLIRSVRMALIYSLFFSVVFDGIIRRLRKRSGNK